MINIKYLIEYYYGFRKFSYSRDNYRTIVKNDNRIYYLYVIDNPDEVVGQYELVGNSKNFYKFVLNVNNSIISPYNGLFYVLLEDNNKGVGGSKFDIDDNSLSTNNLISLNWRELWIKKSDYISYYYSNIIGKYKLIDESIDYYLGMLEVSIIYLNDYSVYNDVGFIQHKEFNIENVYNPLNVKVDVKERDFAEYLKYLFYKGDYKNEQICSLITKYRDYYNFELVVARLLYPNYYFDMFDRIIIKGDKENILYKVINRSREYEEYIRNIITCVSRFFDIKKIDWL